MKENNFNSRVFLTILMHIILKPVNGSLPGVIVPGIYLEETDMPLLTLYDHLVPIVYEFKLPIDFLNNPAPNTPDARVIPKYLCRTDTKNPSLGWYFTCPIFFHANEILTQLKSNFTNIFPSSKDKRAGPEVKTFDSNLNLLFKECDEFVKLEGWAGINYRDAGINEYMKLVEKCSMANYFEVISDYNETNISLFDKIRENYVNNYNITEEGTVGMLLGLQSLLTITTLTELQRWKDAAISCNNNQIPSSLLKVEKLEEAMSAIKTKIGSDLINKFDLILATSQLYQTPLTSCIFGAKSLFIRILVPIRRSQRTYRPLKSRQPNFLYKSQICNINSKDALGANSANYIFDRGTRVIFRTKCSFEHGGLCRIPKSIAPDTDKCLNAALNSVSIEAVKKYCKIDCEQLQGNETLPLIEKVGSNKFIITLDKITTILIKCEAYGRKDQMIPPQEYGAVEITLPCNCYLMFHADKFYPSPPCGTFGSVTIVQHAIPIHMINTTFTFPIRPGYESARISSYYSNRYTMLNLSKYVNFTFKDEDLIEVELGDVPTEPSYESKLNLEQEIKAPNYTAESRVVKENDRIYSSLDPSPLWGIIVLQFIIIIGLGGCGFYKMYILSRKLEFNNLTAVSFSNALSKSNDSYPGSTSQITLEEKV